MAIGAAGGMALVGLSGNALSASSARNSAMRAGKEVRDAAQAHLAYTQGMAQPFYSAGVGAIGGMQSLGEFYKGRLGGSQYLRSQQALGIDEINKAGRQGMASSENYWRGGNVGRARGEQMRIANSTLGALSNARIGYGMAQENFIGQTAQQYAGLLGSLGTLGTGAMSAMIGASKETASARMDSAKLQMQGDQELNMFGSGMAGKVFGYGLDAYMQKQFPDLFKYKKQ